MVLITIIGAIPVSGKSAYICSSVMKEVALNVLGKENPFELIGQQWMLITAGDKDSFNTMTASWGGLGWLWNKPVVLESGAVTFVQASLTAECRKLFKSDMKESDFIDKDVLNRWYGEEGLHSVYVLEIEKLWE